MIAYLFPLKFSIILTVCQRFGILTGSLSIGSPVLNLFMVLPGPTN